MPQASPPQPATAGDEPRGLERSEPAHKWVAVDRNGEKRLATRTRLCIVLVAWAPYLLVPRFEMDPPPPNIQRSTVISYALVALLIAVFHVVSGLAVRGRARLVRDGLTLAFAAALLSSALVTGYERGWH
jgi:hypothetical protein